jgi:hypothetical protein
VAKTYVCPLIFIVDCDGDYNGDHDGDRYGNRDGNCDRNRYGNCKQINRVFINFIKKHLVKNKKSFYVRKII